MHCQLQQSNAHLNELSQQLTESNARLNKINHELAGKNYIKEMYVAHFIRLSSEYLDKRQQFRLEINKALRKGRTEDALRMSLNSEADEETLESFYKNFDQAFLSIFPHFIESYNKLILPEHRISIHEDKKVLTSELRVFALMRLGFNESTTIARMLRYSVNTIYNIRSKAKNKAAVPKETFEVEIMKIGGIESI